MLETVIFISLYGHNSIVYQDSLLSELLMSRWRVTVDLGTLDLIDGMADGGPRSPRF